MNKWPKQKNVPFATADPRNIPGIFLTDEAVIKASSLSERNIPIADVVVRKATGSPQGTGLFVSFRIEYTLPTPKGNKKRMDILLEW